MSTLLLDIEGTVCPISFVKDVLFPYFLDSYVSYLDRLQFPLSMGNDEITNVLVKFPSEHTQTKDSHTKHIASLVQNDVKDPALKAFQGIVWKLGYDNGDLKAPLYADAIRLLQTSDNIYIYSSGSVPAQKLLFSHVDLDGRLVDMTPRLLGYFDITTAGPKQESSSYEAIAKSIGKLPRDIIFYSDNVREVAAAQTAGMQAYVVIRPGNAPLSTEDRAKFECIELFDK